MTVIETKRVRIVGNHPHKGETGSINPKGEATMFGMLLVDLDDCPHWVEACYASPENLRPLPASEDPLMED